MPDLIITMRDIRAAKMCSAGARQFCIRHKINWSSVLENGVSEKELIATGDTMALRVVEIANGRG